MNFMDRRSRRPITDNVRQSVLEDLPELSSATCGLRILQRGHPCHLGSPAIAASAACAGETGFRHRNPCER